MFPPQENATNQPKLNYSITPIQIKGCRHQPL